MSKQAKKVKKVRTDVKAGLAPSSEYKRPGRLRRRSLPSRIIGSGEQSQ